MWGEVARPTGLQHSLPWVRAIIVSVGVVLAVLTAACLETGAARAAGPVAGKAFRLGGGTDPSVAVDDEGTAHIAWTVENPGTTADGLEYCRIPRGKTACDHAESFVPPLPAGADGSKAEGRPRVLLPGVDHVVLLTHRVGLVDFSALTGAVDANCAEDGGCIAEDHLTWAYESFDNGSTWQAPKLIGVVPTEGGAIVLNPPPPFALELAGSTPPNNAPVTTPTLLVGGVSSGFETTAYNLGFQAAPLDGSTTFDVADLGAGRTEASDNSAVGVTPSGQPLVLGHFSGGLTWSRWEGGPLDDVVTGSSTNWTSGSFGTGDYPTLASGPAGLYALSSPNPNVINNNQFVVQRYTGTGNVPFGSRVPVANGIAGELGQDFEQDSVGGIYGVMVARNNPARTDQLHLLTSTDGQNWATTTLASGSVNTIVRPSVSAASDGGGLAVYASRLGSDGTLTAVPFGAATLAPGQIDVRVNAMEITQGVQTFELPARNPANPLNNTVNYHGVPTPDSGGKPVIAKMIDGTLGRATVIRVYANSRTPLSSSLVPAMTLTAFRDGRALYPSPITPDINYATGKRGEPSTLPVSSLEQVPPGAQTDPSAAYTFTLPFAWTSGDVTFQAEINPAGYTPTVAQCTRCRQYNILRLGPIHFTKTQEVAVQPVALFSKKADGTPVYPLGSLDPDPPYTPQAAGLESGSVPPFTGMRAALPQTFDVNPYFDEQDVGGILGDKTLSYITKGARMAALVAKWADGRFKCNCWYVPGIVPKASGFSGGVTPGDAILYGNGDPAVGVWSDDRPLTASSHEFHHTLGGVHAGVNCGSASGGQVGEAWPPDNNGDFYGVGLDTTAPSPYRIISWDEKNRPTDSAFSPAPAAFYDLMSYCGSFDDDHWLSVTNWNREVAFGASHLGRGPKGLPSPGVAADASTAASSASSLSVTASYDLLQNQGQIIDVHPGTGQLAPGGASSTYTLRTLDSSGAVLSTNAATADLAHVEHGPSIIQITGLVPAAGTEAVQVLQNGQVIAERTASAHAPTVRVLSPTRGQQVGHGGVATIRWQAGDADNDPMTASVDYSADGGRSWFSIYEGPAATGHVGLPSRLLARSSKARVRIRVNDGFHETAAVSAQFRSLGAPPTVMIVAPFRNARVAAGGNLNLQATAFDDRPTALSGRAIHWRAGKFSIGTGSAITADNLPAGHYPLTATAKDRFGRIGSASVRITVLPVKPLLRLLRAPRTVSRKARTVKLQVAAITPLILVAGGHQSLVTRTASTVSVRITPGRKKLSLRITLLSGPFRVGVTVEVARH